MRGMATLPQGYQEKKKKFTEKLEDPQVNLG